MNLKFFGMKSILSKLLLWASTCMGLCALVIGGVGIYSSQKIIDDDSARIMNLSCAERAREFDALLSRIEQSVRTLAIYALESLDSLERLKADPDYLNAYTRQIEPVALNTGRNTEGGMGVYLRFNPDFAPPTSGLFWGKLNSESVFHEIPPTDFSAYSPDDAGRVGWYYKPIERGKATWMEPYYNENINTKLLSYVIPLHGKGQEPIGIIGMDINFDTIIAIMDRIDVHPQQRVCLMGSDGICYYSRVSGMQHEEEGANCALLPTLGKMHGYSSGNHLIPYSCGGQEYHMAYHTLKNGMLLAISAPTAVINASRNNLVMQIALLSLISIILAIASSFFVGRHIVHPLRELNSAAQRIASGDMDITLIPHTQDEVGTLTKTLQQTVDHLRHYIHYINDLAYRDPLTGLKNKAAYHEAKLRLEELILRKKPVFALLVIDINGLKEINDIYGHDFGDMLIINASRIIGRVFKHSPVFRIGGDEFVVLLEDIDYQDRPRLLEELQKLIDIHNQSSKPEMRVFMARGLAEYDSEIDSSFGDVFQRADKAMYENKAIMKTGAVLDDDL